MTLTPPEFKPATEHTTLQNSMEIPSENVFGNPTTPSATACLEFQNGELVSIGDRYTVGRAAFNHVVLNDSTLDRLHAMFCCGDEDEVFLWNLGSVKPLVNGRPICSLTLLADGDCVQCGRTMLWFRSGRKGSAERPNQTNQAPSAKRFMKIDRGPRWLILISLIGDETHLQQDAKMESERGIHSLRACQQVLESHQAVVSKYLGTGFLSFWPEVLVETAHVVAAVQGLRRLQAPGDLAFRAVLHFGEVLIDRRIVPGQDSLLGVQVNFLFSMDKLAKNNGLHWLLSDRAAAFLRDKLDMVSAGRHATENFEGEHEFFTPAGSDRAIKTSSWQ